jgi:hypothetical protein
MKTQTVQFIHRFANEVVACATEDLSRTLHRADSFTLEYRLSKGTEAVVPATECEQWLSFVAEEARRLAMRFERRQTNLDPSETAQLRTASIAS